ncbi:ATP-binding protein [Nocardia sp. NPDC058658]|uniref:ATP-binding protein n=1 Tax=Nocardia sp. NPDC058658 TaxID=3346580 RepID=UPI00364A845B
MSLLEEQAFLATRQSPSFDRRPVEGADLSDLDGELLGDFARTARLRDRQGLGRFEGDELLRRSGVVDADGRPTVAGLLTLGTYPQQWFPRLVIQAAAEPSPGDPPGTRARNPLTITGPIPRMLDTAMEWAQQTFDTAIVTNPDGSVVDRPSYPLIAFRELIANALLHRDLDNWSQGMAVEVRLRRDRLIVSNPGGLYGITIDRLGKEAVTSARNARLVTISQYLRSPGSGGRVVEALATGIPTITDSLILAGLPPAQYSDTGIRFTAVLHSGQQNSRANHFRNAGRRMAAPSTTFRQEGSRSAARVNNIRAGNLTATQQRITELLMDGPRTVSELQPPLGLTPGGIRKALSDLQVAGLVRQVGGRGQRTIYHLTDANIHILPTDS